MTESETEATSQDTLRYVELTRQRKARYAATSRRGATIEVGEGDDTTFTPVELLLTALAAWHRDGLVVFASPVCSPEQPSKPIRE